MSLAVPPTREPRRGIVRYAAGSEYEVMAMSVKSARMYGMIRE
jgi:hypothetical protein